MVLCNAKPIEIVITGNDLDVLSKYAKIIEDSLKKNPNLTNIQNSLANTKPEFRITFDKDRMADLKINPGMAAMQVRQSLYGTEAGKYNEQGNEIPINVRYKRDELTSINDVLNIRISSLTGNSYALREVADVNIDNGYAEIMHDNQQRVAIVGADITNDIDLGTMSKEVQKMINNINHSNNVMIQLKGQVEEQQESFSSLILILIISVILVYMIMANSLVICAAFHHLSLLTLCYSRLYLCFLYNWHSL